MGLEALPTDDPKVAAAFQDCLKGAFFSAESVIAVDHMLAFA